MKIAAFSAVMSIAFGASAAQALTFVPLTTGPLELDPGNQTRTFVTIVTSGSTSARTNLVSTEAQDRAVDALGQSAAVRANLATGSTGASASLAPPAEGAGYAAANADAKIFDLVQFVFPGASSGLVTFSLTVDETISNADAAGGSQTVAIGWGTASVFDVTGLPSPFLVLGSDGGEGNLVRADAQGFFDDTIPPFGEFVFTNRPAHATAGLALIPGGLEADVADGSYAIGGADEYQVNTTGDPVAFSKTVEASFVAEAGRFYAFEVSTNVSVSGDSAAAADLLGATTFGFTDLSGGVAFSASGLLPGTSPATTGADATVPLPAPVALLAAAVLGLGAAARRRAPAG